MTKTFNKTRKGTKSKTRNTLTTAQVDYLILLISQGLKEGEINSLTASFAEPFTVSGQQLYNYRHSRDKRIKELRAEHEDEIINTGLALRANRIRKLVTLAERLEQDLLTKIASDEKVWLEDRKAVGQTIYDFKVFNSAEIDQYRKVLDDIAKELGHRVNRTDLTSGDKPIKGYQVVTPTAWGSKEGAEPDES